MEAKYIFVTGCEATSLRKGLFSASLARLLLSYGFRVTIQKLEPCVNIDVGSLSGSEHGECHVTKDGYEVGQELGLYERFADIDVSRVNHITLGQVFQSVLNKERRGDYLGKKVQVMPHITDEIKHQVQALGLSGKYDFIITDIGGMPEDLGTLTILEAMRQLKLEDEQKCVSIHLSNVPCVNEAEDRDLQTIRNAVGRLQACEVHTDVLVLCSDEKMSTEECQQIALNCDVDKGIVVQCMKSSFSYDLPFKLHEQHLEKIISQKTGTPFAGELDLAQWNNFLEYLNTTTEVVNIGLVGRVVASQEAYGSIKDVLLHSLAYRGRELNLRYINSENLNDGNVEDALDGLDGVVVAPGMGSQGFEGKVVALKWCREHDMPTLGIGQGMHSMVVEYARNVMGYVEANSSEMDVRTPFSVVDLMEEQKKLSYIGGLLRLGEYRCVLAEDSLVAKAYSSTSVKERHHNSFEFNSNYRDLFESAGMRCVGVNPDTNFVDVIEVIGKTWYVGTQFHPEYNSTVLCPNPLIMDFVRAVIEKKEINKKLNNKERIKP